MDETKNKEENREDRTNVQIEISLDDTSSQSHDKQTLVEATTFEASLHDENTGVYEMTPDDLDHLKYCLNSAISRDRWYEAQSIFDNSPDMIRIPLNASGNIALHVAVSKKRSIFVKELVNLMTPEDLEIPNAEGETAFCMAVVTGNDHFLQIMIGKNENLLMIPGPNRMLPIHLAASSCHHKIVKDLSSHNLVKRMDYKDVERLFFLTLNNNMYDVATTLFENHSALAIARDDQYLTALHMLARKHPQEFYMQQDMNIEVSSGWGHGLHLFIILWREVSEFESDMFMELTTKPSAVLVDIVKSGNINALKWILYVNRELLTIKDSKERNLLHYAVFYRQRSIFNFLLRLQTEDLMREAVDKDGNNVLHLAAYKPIDALPSLTSDIKREILWYKEVEKTVSPELKKMRNIDGETPEGIFLNKYAEIFEEVKASAKRITDSGMIVATLTSTIAFTAVLTAPGEKSNKWFIVFFLSNAVALFTSSASIVSFMLTLGSRFTKGESIIFLLPYVNLGRWLLFLSIAAMVVAFTAVSFLIFDHKSKWVAYVVTSLVLIPITFMVLVLVHKIFPSFQDLIDNFFAPRLDMTVDPRKYQCPGKYMSTYQRFGDFPSQL